MKDPIDLHLIPSKENISEMMFLGKKMGYKTVGISVETGLNIPHIPEINSVKRIDVTPRNQNHLQKVLKSYRKKFEIISVQCFSKKILRQAVKNNRVDIINIPSNREKAPLFGRSEAVLARDNMISFEVNITDLFSCCIHKQLGVLDKLGKDVWNAHKHDIPIISSSGARKPSLMREPRAIVSLLNVLSIGEEKAIEMVTKNPSEIIKRNKSTSNLSFELV